MPRQCFSRGTAADGHTPSQSTAKPKLTKISTYDHVYQIFINSCTWFRRGVLCDRGYRYREAGITSVRYIILLIANRDYFSIPLYRLMLRGTHYYDFRGASLRRESPTIGQFNQPNFPTNNKENTKSLLVCCDGIHWWPIDCLREGPITLILFWSHDIYMTSLNTDCRHANHATHRSVRWRKHLIVWCVPQNQPHCQKRHGSNAELACVKIVRVEFKCTICPYWHGLAYSQWIYEGFPICSSRASSQMLQKWQLISDLNIRNSGHRYIRIRIAAVLLVPCWPRWCEIAAGSINTNSGIWHLASDTAIGCCAPIETRHHDSNDYISLQFLILIAGLLSVKPLTIAAIA